MRGNNLEQQATILSNTRGKRITVPPALKKELKNLDEFAKKIKFAENEHSFFMSNESEWKQAIALYKKIDNALPKNRKNLFVEELKKQNKLKEAAIIKALIYCDRTEDPFLEETYHKYFDNIEPESKKHLMDFLAVKTEQEMKENIVRRARFGINHGGPNKYVGIFANQYFYAVKNNEDKDLSEEEIVDQINKTIEVEKMSEGSSKEGVYLRRLSANFSFITDLENEDGFDMSEIIKAVETAYKEAYEYHLNTEDLEDTILAELEDENVEIPAYKVIKKLSENNPYDRTRKHTFQEALTESLIEACEEI